MRFKISTWCCHKHGWDDPIEVWADDPETASLSFESNNDDDRYVRVEGEHTPGLLEAPVWFFLMAREWVPHVAADPAKDPECP